MCPDAPIKHHPDIRRKFDKPDGRQAGFPNPAHTAHAYEGGLFVFMQVLFDFPDLRRAAGKTGKIGYQLKWNLRSGCRTLEPG